MQLLRIASLLAGAPGVRFAGMLKSCATGGTASGVRSRLAAYHLLVMNSTSPPRCRVRAIIFDMDGTLADTFPLIVSAWNAAITPLTGITYSEQDVISRFGIPDPQMIRRELQSKGGAACEQAIEMYHAHYERRHRETVRPFEGITEMLEALRRRGVPMGMMTGKGRRSARITLECLGWSGVFDSVVTGDDVPEQKPDPSGPLAVARALDVPAAECAFVGDSPADIGAGQAAGMVTVAAAWHPVYLDEIRRMKPDVWAATPAEILRLIE
jgi:pyrophosphatase PpaX